MEKEWKWGDEKECTQEQIDGKIEMLEYLISNSHYSSLEDMDKDKQGWTKEELEEELSKLNNKVIWKKKKENS